MNLYEIVIQLGQEIESMLPGCKIWVRLDRVDFQFLGLKCNVENCVQISPYYQDSNIPQAASVAEYMKTVLNL